MRITIQFSILRPLLILFKSGLKDHFGVLLRVVSYPRTMGEESEGRNNLGLTNEVLNRGVVFSLDGLTDRNFSIYK